jgi:hypothetical protein
MLNIVTMKTRIYLYGDLPKHNHGSNKGRINHQKVAIQYNFTAKEVEKAYLNWIHIFRFTESTLTFKQYLDKLLEVKITPTDVGNKINQYNLSRFNDKGPYTNDSCRFILSTENLKEQFRKPVTIVQMICLYCDKQYQRPKGSENNKKFCSLSCSAFYIQKQRRENRSAQVPICKIG